MRIKNYTILDTKGNFYLNQGKLGENQFSEMEDMYNYLKIDYPKFYKMDPLSQLGFILTEELMKESFDDKPDGILVWNKHSSYHADIKHLYNLKNGISGPANFTYTLPNIVLGEIAIRHKITGETGVFLMEELVPSQTATITEMYMKTNRVERILIGWLDAGPEKPVGFVCDVVVDPSNIDIFSAEIEKIYKRIF